MEESVALEALFGGMAAMASVIWFLSMAITIATIVAQWRICVKMGEPGWAALIPFYNMFVLAKHIFGNGWAMLLLLVPVAGMPIFFFKLFQGFGASIAAALLLAIFVSPIGMLVYGFNSTPWQGM